MIRRFSLSGLSLCLLCSLLVGGCGRSAPETPQGDRKDWGRVAAELDSLQAAQNALRDSLAARTQASSERESNQRNVAEDSKR